MVPDSLAGRTLGGYHLLARIGAGGMGEVYRAHDSRLGRDVALKILRDEISADPDRRQRFEQEARAASALNHPHIVTIHEIGRDGPFVFIAQELIDGEALRDRLERGPLPLADALAVARQVAEALATAHAADILHRDVKPENIMLRRDGYAKVVDFGVAKLAAPMTAGGDTATALRTAPGLVMGTAGYMSPEQARGQAVDARTDVFAVGALVYEMIAGRRAFGGATATDAIAATLTVEPPHLTTLAPDAPSDLERLVAKALRKNPDERYQSMKELLVDLKALSISRADDAGLGSKRPRFGRVAAAVALLLAAAGAAAFYVRDAAPLIGPGDRILLTDFENTTGDAVFDGPTLRQALTVQLQQTPFLRVFPMESVRGTLTMMARSPDEQVHAAIAREICLREGLKAFVVGSIARLGTHYVLTLESIAAESGATLAITQVEADTQERVLASLGEAARDLRRELGESLGSLAQFDTPIEQATTPSLEALRAYSAGLEQLYRENGRAAVPFFVRATEIDPGFSAAYDNGAWAFLMSGGDPKRAFNFAEQAYRTRERATEREKLSAASTYHHIATGDWDEENRIYAVWQRLYPTDFVPHVGYGLNNLLTGRFAETVTNARQVLVLAPNIAQGYRLLTPALVRLGRLDEALDTVREAHDRKLDNVFLRSAVIDVALARGDAAGFDAGVEAVRQAEGERLAITWEARRAALEGRWRDAAALYERTLPSTAAGTPTGRLPAEAVRRAALFGVCDAAGADAASAIERIAHAGVSYTPIVGDDGALCGTTDRAESFVAEITRRFPQSTLNRLASVPTFRAAIALRRNQPAQALEALRSAGETGFGYWTQYLRGQAHLRLDHGQEAAQEFRTILANRAWEPSSPFLPLAELGLARAAAIAGDRAGSRRAYQAFFERWRNADADLPIVVRARQEFARVPESERP